MEWQKVEMFAVRVLGPRTSVAQRLAGHVRYHMCCLWSPDHLRRRWLDSHRLIARIAGVGGQETTNGIRIEPRHIIQRDDTAVRGHETLAQL